MAGNFITSREQQKQEDLRKRLAIQAEFAEDKKRRLSLQAMKEQQQKLEESKMALMKASTIVECQTALKSYDVADLGQGHPKGGTREHGQNRLHILNRLRAKAKPLPPAMLNDWEWFCKHWDHTRLANLPLQAKASWGSQFQKIISDLAKNIRDDGDALARWMTSERKKWLTAPALHL